MQAEDSKDDVFTFAPISSRSYDDEIGGTIRRDIAYLVVALSAVFVYSVLAMSSWDQGLSGLRIGLTTAGAL